jgi:hypothetical protein
MLITLSSPLLLRLVTDKNLRLLGLLRIPINTIYKFSRTWLEWNKMIKNWEATCDTCLQTSPAPIPLPKTYIKLVSQNLFEVSMKIVLTRISVSGMDKPLKKGFFEKISKCLGRRSPVEKQSQNE